MTHSRSCKTFLIGRKYYQHVEGVSKSVEAYGDITKKRRGADEEILSFQPKPKKRRLWSHEEVEKFFPG